MGSETSDDPSPSPPSSIPRVTPAKARNIASGLKRLADEYTEIGMHHEAHSMMRGSEWWLAYAEKKLVSGKPIIGRSTTLRRPDGEEERRG